MHRNGLPSSGQRAAPAPGRKSNCPGEAFPILHRHEGLCCVLSSILAIMLKPTGLDRVALRASFNAKAEADDRAEFLLSDVERRLDERLDYMKLPAVGRVLDLGCGLGRSLPVLARRFPDAELLALDFAERPLQARQRLSDQARRGLRGLLSRFRVREQTRQPVWVAADAHRLPLAADSIDVIWSNLAFHWFDDPLAVLAECHRVLKPNGLLIFSAFGVDTCRELRAESTRMLLDRPGVPLAAPAEHGHDRAHAEGRGVASASGTMAAEAGGASCLPASDVPPGQASSAGRVVPNDRATPGERVAPVAGEDEQAPAPRATWPSFQDMHDWGDAMVGAGLEAPVMDAERLQLSYRTPEALSADMQALGFPHCPDAFVPMLSVELVFGHAWVPVKKGQRAQKGRADGLAPIHVVRRSGGKS